MLRYPVEFLTSHSALELFLQVGSCFACFMYEHKDTNAHAYMYIHSYANGFTLIQLLQVSVMPPKHSIAPA